MNAMLPVQPDERIHILDVLRGFAVFGILVVNIAGFAGPVYLPGYLSPQSLPWYDALAQRLVLFLAEGKFYTIFSFLFGLGFSVQIERAVARGKDIRSFYPRRLWVLLGMGILHSALLWTGDILRIYALLGFMLLAFRQRSNRTLLTWVGIFFTLSFVLMAFTGGLVGGGSMGRENSSIPGFDIIAIARSVYHGPSYLKVLIFQALSSPVSFAIILLTQGSSVMALLLLGLLAGRLKFFEQMSMYRAIMRRICFGGLLMGLAGNSLLLSRNPWLTSLGFSIGAPGLAAAYVSGLSLLSLSEGGEKATSPLGKVGRMALSNYVLQSVICSMLFDGFGFGLYEKIGAAGLLGMAVSIYLLQIPLSVWWLKHFYNGPFEWLWRSLTYRQRQPFYQSFSN